MRAQDVFFETAIVRISIHDRTTDPSMPLFTAQFSIVDDDGARLHALVFDDGYRVEIHAPTESLALNSAISFLQNRFGSLSEYEHASPDFAPRAVLGEPIVVGEAHL